MSSKPKVLTDDEREELLAAGHIVPRKLKLLDLGHKQVSMGFHEPQRRRPAKVQHPKPGAAA